MTRRIFGTGGILAILLSLSGCGGSSSSPSTPAPTATTLPVNESTFSGNVNTPVVTLHICIPNTSTCQDVPNILVDFGSTGLRLSHTLPIAGALPQEQIGGQPLYECYSFESGYNFGPVVTATVSLGTTPVTVPVQISNSTLTAPSSCTSGSSSAPFEPYINGILGVLFPQYDFGTYYDYEGNTYNNVNFSLSDMVQNPVYLLSDNNDGVLLSFPSVSPTIGAPTITGTLTFGAPSGKLLQTDHYGEINATLDGNSYSAFFDSGSSNFYFDDSAIHQCTIYQSPWFCPKSPVFLQPTLSSANGASTLFSFFIVNANTLFSTGNLVFSSLGAPGFQSGLLDAGFPAFLYGHNIGLSWTSTCSPSSNSGQGCFVIQQ